MKRTYKAEVRCRPAYSGYNICISASMGPYNSTAIVLEDFQGVFGFTPSLCAVRYSLKICLVGEPMPWDDWTWGMGVYEPGHIILEIGDTDDNIVIFDKFVEEDDTGRAAMCVACLDGAERVFPGLAKAIGYGNACEAEVSIRRLV